MITSRLAVRAAALVAALGALALSAPGAFASGPVAGAARVGSAPRGQQLNVLLPLKVEHRGLGRLATAVSTPGSDEYGRYRTVAEIARRFGARPSVRAHVIKFLRRAGATHVSVDRAGLFASATVTVRRAQRLFGTRLSSFREDAESGVARFVAPQSPARVPRGLGADVSGVVGLDTEPISEGPAAGSPSLHSDAQAIGSAYFPRSGTPSGCRAGVPRRGGFTPSQYTTAYGLARMHQFGDRGHGERVALLEIDGFKRSDVTTFTRCFGLPAPHITTYGVGITRPLPPGGESTLDLEVLSAAAPRLSAIELYESGPSPTDVLASLVDAIENRVARPDVISASLGGCEAINKLALGRRGLSLYEEAFEMAAATGISTLVAAGDDGSSNCLDSRGEPKPELAVSFPASSPFVTAVGGTNVRLNSANRIVSDDVWNDAPAQLSAGGGGDSRLFAEPSYQRHAEASGRRELPDVSMLGDLEPGYEIYCTAKVRACSSPHGWLFIGGTSAGTPLLAGGIALVDQRLRVLDRAGVGFANPLLYTLARSPSAPSIFHDVTTGSNDLFETEGDPLGCCHATVGYDNASGLGEVNLAALAKAARPLSSKLGSVSVKVAPGQLPVAKHHLKAKVTCTAACVMSAVALFRFASGHVVSVAAGILPGQAGKPRTLTIRLPQSLRSSITDALRRNRTVTVTVRGLIVDGGGAVERRSRAVTLHVTG